MVSYKIEWKNLAKKELKSYRVIYLIDLDRVLIEVLRIAHRKEVYRQFTA